MMPRRHTEMSTAAPEAPPTDAPPADAPPVPAPPAGTPPAEQPNDAETPDAKIARLEQSVKDANAEAAKHRVKGKTAADEAQAELAQRIGKALGLVQDEQATPEQLTQQVIDATTARETAEAAAKAAQVELAVFRAADAAGADAQALLDSRSFTDSLADVDSTDSEAITNAIKAAVTNNPRLRKTQVVGSSSADHPGGSGESRDPATASAPGMDRLRAAYAT